MQSGSGEDDSLLAELAKIPERTPALTAGSKLGPYEIRAPLGQGGMGQVYRAHDPRLGREVAIKVLPRIEEELVRRFEQEARALGALQHPNVLAVHDVGAQEDVPYLVFELLDGVTLTERMAAAPLPIAEAIALASQIARGLAAAHDKGIIHRDLKPDNVFVTRAGQAKILDFGLAKAARATDGKETALGAVIGTPHYMSPEQVRGKPVDARSDIFSFGLVLFEMVTGRHPFRRESAAETMSTIANEPMPPLDARTGAPPALERLVRHCLEKKPEDRFQSAHDLVYSLETLPAAGPAPRRASRAWLLAAGGAVAVAAIAIVATAIVTAPRRATTGAATAPAPLVARYRQVTFRNGVVLRARFTPDGHTYAFTAAWDDQPPESYAALTEGTGARALGLSGAEVQAIAPDGEMAVVFEGGRLAVVPLGGGAAPREVASDVGAADWMPNGTDLAAIRLVDHDHVVEMPLGREVYRSRARLRSLRVLPDGEHAAMIEHPTPGDDGGRVIVVDTHGARRELGSAWPSMRGLALSGREIWFSAGASGGMSEVHALALGGDDRVVATVPGAAIVYDVSRDGRVLLATARMTQTLMARVPGGPRSPLHVARLLARRRHLEGRPHLALRRDERRRRPRVLDVPSAHRRAARGAPRRRRAARALSRRQVRARPPHGAQQPIVLVPTGAGTTRTLTHDDLDHTAAWWFPDGARVLFLGAARAHRPQLFVQALDGGAARPIGVEGMTDRAAITPDGAAVAVADEAGAVWKVPVDGSAPRPIAGLDAGQVPLRYLTDGALLVARAGELPLRIERLAPDGKRAPWKVIAPTDAGHRSQIFFVASESGDFYAYSYTRARSELYLVTGLGR